MSDTLYLPNARLVAINAALGILANRKLPSISSDFKVARRLESIKPALTAFEALRKKAIEAHTGPDGELLRPADLQDKLTTLAAEMTEIPKPKAKLTEADMPKALKDDEKNGAGIAAIVSDLGVEFFEMPDE